jgi:hypothetical protein
MACFPAIAQLMLDTDHLKLAPFVPSTAAYRTYAGATLEQLAGARVFHPASPPSESITFSSPRSKGLTPKGEV